MILNLEMNPSKVDVNVHPAKLEVRFENEDVIFKAMYHAVKDTLLKANLISDREKTKEAHEASKDAFKIQAGFAKGLGGLFRKKEEVNIEEKENLFDTRKDGINTMNNTLNSDIDNELPKIFRKQESEKAEITNQEFLAKPTTDIENSQEEFQKSNEEQSVDSLDADNEKIQKEEKNENTADSQIIKSNDDGPEPIAEENVIEQENENDTNILDNKFNEGNEEIENNVPKTLQQKIEEELSFKEMYKKLFGKEP